MKILDDEKDLLLDHEYDGIKELDNHMPVWWLWLFYVTIIFSIGYMAYYYLLGGPSQEELYEMEMAEAAERYNLDGPESSGSAHADFEWAYLQDEQRIAEGKELYSSTNNLCFTCHGANGEGLIGPNLTDDFWIHGCSPEELAKSIIDGFLELGMLPYGSGTRLSNEQVQSLISYLASIQGTDPAGAKPHETGRATPCTI